MAVQAGIQVGATHSHAFFFFSELLKLLIVALLHVSIVSVYVTSKQQVLETFSFPNGGKTPPLVCQSCSNKARNSRHPPPSEQLQREHLCNGVPVLLLVCMSDVPALGIFPAHFFGRSG